MRVLPCVCVCVLPVARTFPRWLAVGWVLVSDSNRQEPGKAWPIVAALRDEGRPTNNAWAFVRGRTGLQRVSCPGGQRWNGGGHRRGLHGGPRQPCAQTS